MILTTTCYNTTGVQFTPIYMYFDGFTLQLLQLQHMVITTQLKIITMFTRSHLKTMSTMS